MNEMYARELLAVICKRLYDRGLTVSAGGNMSLRMNSNEIIITPSGVNKGVLSPKDFITVDMSGRTQDARRPSIETKMHLALYNANPKTNAVIHCHPLHCIALTLQGKKINSSLTPEGVLLLGEVPTVPYFTPGTAELADAVGRLASYDAILMAKHGAIAQGTTLEEAFDRMEELEFQARLQLLAGDVEGLSPEEIAKVRK